MESVLQKDIVERSITESPISKRCTARSSNWCIIVIFSGAFVYIVITRDPFQIPVVAPGEMLLGVPAGLVVAEVFAVLLREEIAMGWNEEWSTLPEISQSKLLSGYRSLFGITRRSGEKRFIWYLTVFYFYFYTFYIKCRLSFFPAFQLI